MKKRMCPYCDQEMESARYCRGCRRIVWSPQIREVDYYLNKRHPARETDCSYHGTASGWSGEKGRAPSAGVKQNSPNSRGIPFPNRDSRGAKRDERQTYGQNQAYGQNQTFGQNQAFGQRQPFGQRQISGTRTPASGRPSAVRTSDTFEKRKRSSIVRFFVILVGIYLFVMIAPAVLISVKNWGGSFITLTPESAARELDSGEIVYGGDDSYDYDYYENDSYGDDYGYYDNYDYYEDDYDDYRYDSYGDTEDYGYLELDAKEVAAKGEPCNIYGHFEMTEEEIIPYMENALAPYFAEDEEPYIYDGNYQYDDITQYDTRYLYDLWNGESYLGTLSLSFDTGTGEFHGLYLTLDTRYEEATGYGDEFDAGFGRI